MIEPTSLELRLESIKYRGDLRLEYLKRFYDGRPILEQCLNGDVTLHVHGFIANRPYCLTHRRAILRDGETDKRESEVNMLIRIRNVLQPAYPNTAIERLEPAYRCLVFTRNSLEVAVPRLRPFLWPIFDRK